MTTITLRTNDQALSVVLKPLIASGDYNLVKVQVEFDSAWDRYTVRSAVFRTLNGAETEVLLTDDECIIPHEVLAEPGTLFIALRGITYSGNVIKTTAEVKYKIVQGAKDIASTTAPSHDMYAQYMAAIAAGIAPHLEAVNEKVDGRIAELDALAGSFIRMKTGSYTGTGTWGAENPTVLEADFNIRMAIVYEAAYDAGGHYANDETAKNKKAYSEKRQEFLYGASSFIVNASDNSQTNGLQTFTMNGNTLSFYMTADTGNYGYYVKDDTAAKMQMNGNGTRYYYILIGV